MAVAEVFIAFNDDMAYLHLRFLVDVDIKDYLILASHIIALHNIYLCILETFLVEIFLCQYLGTVYHVGSDLVALHDTQFGLQVLALRFFDAAIVYLAYTGSQGEMDAEIYLGVYYRVGSDRNL